MREEVTEMLKSGLEPLQAIALEAYRTGDSWSDIGSDMQRGHYFGFAKRYIKHVIDCHAIRRFVVEEIGRHDLVGQVGLDKKTNVEAVNARCFERGFKLWEDFVGNSKTNYCFMVGERALINDVVDNIITKKTRPYHEGTQLLQIAMKTINWSKYSMPQAFHSVKQVEMYFVKDKNKFVEIPANEKFDWLRNPKEDVYGPFFSEEEIGSWIPCLDMSKAF